MKVTRRHIQDLFQKCESAYETCLGTLQKIKTLDKADKELAMEFIMFQEVLATPLFELQELRNRISACEKVLIGSKKRYKSSWFKKQMACLSDYKQGIDQVRNIGKGIGDAFVYFFYRNDLALLEKQFRHQRIDTTLGKIGLSGERHFVKNFKQVEGKMAIYHGLSNILRYGDFSFYDLQQHRINGIGELKTRHIEGNQFELQLTMITTELTDKIPEESPAPINPSQNEKGKTPVDSRLKRQVDGIIDILSPDKRTVDFKTSIKGTSFATELQKLYEASKTNRNNYLQVSPGLLYVGARFPKAKMHTRIFNRKTKRITSSIGDEGIAYANALVKKDSADNGLILGNLLYYSEYQDKSAAGTAPLFWYPLSAALLKDLYFSDFLVITIFNPAHILHVLKERGYNVQSKYNTAPPVTGKPNIQYFDSMIWLITNHLQLESSILEMIDSVVDMQKNNKQYSSIMMKPYINMAAVFGPSRAE